MLAASSIFQNKEKWKPHWNKVLVFLFIATYFLNGVTRYKHIIEILMILTVIYQFARSPREYIPLFKNSIFYAIALLSIVLLYSILISPDMRISFKEFNNTVLKGFLLYVLLIPVLLKDADKKTISRLILVSFLASLCLRSLAEIFLYIEDYQNGILPFTNYNHRHISDSLVFLFPALLNLWLFKDKASKAAFVVLGIVYMFLMLGSLSRGAWVAIFIVAIAWAIFNRQWKLLTIGALLFAVAAGVVITHPDQHKNRSSLIFKLQQTDSTYRYGNGTQGTAWVLVQENPIKGYGYGDDIYHEVYNARVKDFPQWDFKKSIGPHNLILYIWFGAGILGLLGLMAIYYTIVKETARGVFRNHDASPYNVELLLFLSFVGFYIIRGNFEQVEISHLGIISGLLLAIKNK
ncbi:O-antigen ligase RfaL [Pseudocitrobacter cyperus]|uniref:O-antigen ligase RfaL n=1 Tax=Pseudocitrobacter cyperus TaxID=3112843 RepID=A0ABV0HM02_9ENTR